MFWGPFREPPHCLRYLSSGLEGLSVTQILINYLVACGGAGDLSKPSVEMGLSQILALYLEL